MVVHVGQNFSANLLAGRSGALQVIVDGRNSNTAMLAINDVRDIVDRYQPHMAGELTAAVSRLRTSRRAPGSIPTWKAAGSSCPASSASSRCW